MAPDGRGGDAGEPELLASCYRKSLELAAAHDVRSIAFPCISVGIFGYPFEQAAQVAVSTVKATVDNLPGIGEVIFCCFTADQLAVYEQLPGINADPLA